MKNLRLYLKKRKAFVSDGHRGRLTGLTISWNEKWVNDEPIFRVVYVAENSIASRAGIQLEDRVVQFNERRIGEFRPYETEAAQFRADFQQTLRIRRGEKEFDVVLRTPAFPKIATDAPKTP